MCVSMEECQYIAIALLFMAVNSTVGKPEISG